LSFPNDSSDCFMTSARFVPKGVTPGVSEIVTSTTPSPVPEGAAESAGVAVGTAVGVISTPVAAAMVDWRSRLL
jgi:hypothetical protein